MSFAFFLSLSDTYLNYQRPRGFLDVSAAVSVTGLGADELLKRFLVKNLLDCEPYRSQEVLRKLLLKKHKEDGLTELLADDNSGLVTSTKVSFLFW